MASARRRRSFSVNSLLSDTPRSNRARLAFWIKRSALSRSGGSSRSRRRRPVLRNSPPKGRRLFHLDWTCSSNEPLVAEEAEQVQGNAVCDVENIPNPCALFGNLVDLVEKPYPALRSRVILSPCCQSVCWLEVLSPLDTYDVNLGPISCLRVSEGLCSLQVLFPLVRNVWRRIYVYI